MLTDISKMLEKRRLELVELLEGHSNDIEVEKQHQIYGAINEIDIFIQTLQFYRKKEINESGTELKLVAPQSTESVFKKIFGNLSNVFRNK